MLIFFAIGAYWQSIKNKPLAIIVMLFVFFGYAFLNKKENPTPHQPITHRQNFANTDTTTNPNINHYGYDSQCTAFATTVLVLKVWGGVAFVHRMVG